MATISRLRNRCHPSKWLTDDGIVNKKTILPMAAIDLIRTITNRKSMVNRSVSLSIHYSHFLRSTYFSLLYIDSSQQPSALPIGPSRIQRTKVIDAKESLLFWRDQIYLRLRREATRSKTHTGRCSEKNGESKLQQDVTTWRYSHTWGKTTLLRCVVTLELRLVTLFVES